MCRITASLKKYTATIGSVVLLALLLTANIATASSIYPLSKLDQVKVLGQHIDLIEDLKGSFKEDQVIKGELDYLWVKNGTETPNFGYTDSTFWYRLIIDNDSNTDQKRLLSISYPLLDQIDFYVTDENKNIIKHIQTGDTLPQSSREFDHRGFLFELDLPRNKMRSVFLRVYSQGSQQLPIELLTEREFFIEDQSILMIKAIYFGMMGIMVIFNLFIFFSLKERSYIYYICFIFSFVFTQAAMYGFSSQYIWPQTPYLNEIIILLCVPTTMIFAALFAIEFLDLSNRQPNITKFLKASALLNSFSCMLAFVVPYSVSTRMSVALVLPVSIVLMGIGPTLWYKGVKEAKYYSLAWIGLVIGTSLAVLNKFGLIPRNVITEHGLVIGSALEAILLSIALADRFNREREQRFKVQQEILEEVNERQRIEQTMLYNSLHSPITKLPNRLLITKKINEITERYDADEFSFAVILIHLERFHEISKTLGHHNADELLVSLSTKLADQTKQLSQIISINKTEDGDKECVANIEGVTFCILLRSKSRDSTELSLELLSKQALGPIEFKGMSLDVGANFGLAYYPDHGDTASSLLRHSHIAIDMAAHKENRIATYSKEINPYNAKRLTLMGELRKAIDENSLELFFQPQVNLHSNSVYGVESLLRWNHPVHGFIPPDEFIILAEQTGIMKSLTNWVIKRAIEFAIKLKRKGIELIVSVNISAMNLHEKGFDTMVKELLERYQLQPDCLLLELTETSVMQDTNRCFQMLEKLHALGVLLSVDDFGTGHSSLAYIKKLPVEEIKIDRSFIMEMDNNMDDEIIVRTTITMCHTFGYKVVAEGVESAAICKMLRELGCDYIQGYYISKPLSGDDLINWLNDRAWEPLLLNQQAS